MTAYSMDLRKRVAHACDSGMPVAAVAARFTVPSGEILHQHRERAAVWGYVQMLIVISIVATGAGLHVAASFIEQQAQVPAVAVMLAVAMPVVLFLALLHALYYFLVRPFPLLIPIRSRIALRIPAEHRARFLDANILLSAAWRANVSPALTLWTIKDMALVTSAFAIEEAERNLDDSAARTRLCRLTHRIEIADEPGASERLPP